MGTLYLVRHGQASFGSDDYDRLSALGARQCERLGQWFREQGVEAFDAVFCGTLTRHRESLAAIERGIGTALGARERSGLNEYDGDAIVRALHPGPQAPARTPEAVRAHFRLLREGLKAWMAGRTQPHGMPAHADFVAGVAAALEEVRAGHPDGRVLVLSSGGPIATAIGLVLDLKPDAVIELNMALRNSALSELRVSRQRLSLVSFNTLAHLGGPERASWVTHA